MKKLRLFSALMAGLILNFVLPIQSGFGQEAYTTANYYNGCGELIWTTGGSNCSNVIDIFLETECDT